MNDQTIAMDNHSGYQWNGTDDGPSFHTRIAFACTWIIISVAGIIGNSLVIFVAIRFQKMSNVTNCFIVNLAITDIVFLAFCMPLLVVQYILEQWLLDQIFCKLLNFISFVSVLVTVLTLVAMTIDRYIYVVRPFENLKWRKPRTVLLLSIIIWLISCIFASPFYHHYGVTNIHDNHPHPQCVLLSEEPVQKQLRIYTVTLYYFIPLTIIVISYAKLLHFVYSKDNKVKNHTKHNIIRRSKKRRAVTKMVAIVTLVFAICWLPITLCIMSANIFEHKTAFLYYFKMVANSFAYLNSAINPILYAFLNRSFRNNCGSLFSEPSCSLFCRDEYHQNQSQQQKSIQKHRPSTQIDRFSYQSTNCQSPSSIQETINRKLLIVNNRNQLTAEMTSHTDYSDEGYEMFDVVESNNQVPAERNTLANHRSVAMDEITNSNTLTTVL